MPVPLVLVVQVHDENLIRTCRPYNPSAQDPGWEWFHLHRLQLYGCHDPVGHLERSIVVLHQQAAALQISILALFQDAPWADSSWVARLVWPVFDPYLVFPPPKHSPPSALVDVHVSLLDGRPEELVAVCWWPDAVVLES